MSTKFYYTKNGKKVTVEDTPLATGGEGSVHKITSSLYSGNCIKLYHDKARTADKQRKIESMIAHPPTDLQGTNYLVCWPKEIIFSKNKKFIGFIMPLAFSSSRELYELCPLQNRLPTAWEQKYDRKTGDGLTARMKLCTNLAASVHRVHFLKKYVFADIKPQNILVTDDSKVSLIDLDSIQISENNQIIFSALVSTPEYEPPESEVAKARGSLVLEESWDRFSIAVIFYEVLFGIHPYTATFSGHYQFCNTTSERIRDNLFVHGVNKKYVDVLPPPHENYHKIPTSLQDLFTRAFDINLVKRPSVEEFGKVFYQIACDADKQAFPSGPMFPSLSPTQTSSPQTITKPKKNNVSFKISAYIKKALVLVVFFTLIAFVIRQEILIKKLKFPMEACGEKFPESTHGKPHENMWYSVYTNSYVGINEAKKYCQDALKIHSKILNTEVIQLASFLDKDKAINFANEMKKYLGEAEIGGILIEVEEYVDGFIKNPDEDNEIKLKGKIAKLPIVEPPQDRTEARRLNEEGRNYCEQDNYTNAIDSFLKGYKKDSTDAEIASNLAFAYYMSNELENARKNAILSIISSPMRVAPWTLLGEILAKKGESKMAVNCFLIAYRFSNKNEFLEKIKEGKRPGEDKKVRLVIDKAVKEIELNY